MRSFDRLQYWKQDLPASVVVFLVALPLCLGIALASNAPIISGLIAGAVGGIIIGFGSKSELGVSGPAAGLVAIVIAAIEELGGYETFLLAVVLAGAMQFLFGVFRAGIIAYYFPNSVINGMLAGIGITIFMKQIPHAVGYDKDFMGDESFVQPDQHNTLTEWFYMLDGVNMGAVIITAICVALMVLWERPFIKRSSILKMVPGPLLAVAVGGILAKIFGGIPGLAIGPSHFVNLPDIKGIWDLPSPVFDGIGDRAVWRVAFTIAVVASIETLLCVEATDKLDPWKRTTPANRELKAQGIGNMVSGMLGGLPLTQVIVRSSANIQSGGRTRNSAIVHGLLVVVAALLLPDLLRAIPFACLAAVLLLVGYKLIKPKQFRTMWKAGLMQFLPFMITVVGVYFIDLLWGVGLGLAVAVIHILWKNYSTPFHFDAKTHMKGTPIHIQLSEDVTFLNKAGIKRTLHELPEESHVILDASRTMDLDPDVLEIIENFMWEAQKENTQVDLIGFQCELKDGRRYPSFATKKDRKSEVPVAEEHS